ncbi:MAG: Thioredoxin reductase [candidate division WS6 bacterium GW2011_GWA2_37_6]|uniref:Thioredoxin reductase n=1 Tax=candidate division WS6 bacterium GW2011_GWA2_37_6 TaxID=1619087 RepID=A0A0G0HBF8_9BACT|nr:MAG: Thioredoxin reductase [candidate division WS6 bacterium GW2011_GWA2_37_6]
MEKLNLVIIGSGPAGLTAAIYAARAGLSPIIFAGANIGGQLMQTTMVENFPGFEKGILGPELMQKMVKQAENMGSKLKYEAIDKVDFSKRPFKLWAGNNSYEAKSVIIATGAVPKRLGLDAEMKLLGRGVSNCATCDGAFYKDKVVAVVGGGSVAFEDANYMTRHAKKVYLIHRRDEFKAEKVLIDRAKASGKIEFLLNYEVKEILGKEKLTGIVLQSTKVSSETKELKLDGLFTAIGYIPKTDIFKGQVELDEKGYIAAKQKSMTSVEGVFVAGDAEDFMYRQAITAAGDGCRAAMDLEEWYSRQT